MKDRMFHCYDATLGGEYGMSNVDRGPIEKIPSLRTMDGVRRVVGRKIVRVSPFLGSYGMGGAGFFGWQLKADRYRPEEWLVLTLWGSDNWMLLDKRPLHVYPLDEKKYKPWVTATMFDVQEKETNKLMAGYTIKEFDVNDRDFQMVLGRRGKKNRILELPSNLAKLPPYGNETPRTWDTDEKLLDGFLISKSEYISI